MQLGTQTAEVKKPWRSPGESQTTALVETGDRRPLSQHTRLADRVADLLQERILRAEVRPGDRVAEQKVAQDFGVGQHPVREALIELAHLGFVRRHPRRGTFVTLLTQADVDKITRVRNVLEDLAMNLICTRSRTEPIDFSRAEEALALMHQAARQENVLKFHENDLQFHRILWALAGNEYLERALEQLVTPLFAFKTLRNVQPMARVRTVLEGVADHEAILTALKGSSVMKLGEARRRFRRRSMRFGNATRSGDRPEVKKL